MADDKNYLPFEEEGDLYTDERSDPPSKQEQDDPANAGTQTDQGFDADAAEQEKAKPTTRHTTDTVTTERENPAQAVRDSYLDS